MDVVILVILYITFLNIQKYVIVWTNSPEGYTWKYNSTDNNTLFSISENQTIDADTSLVLSRQAKRTGMGVAALKIAYDNGKFEI